MSTTDVQTSCWTDEYLLSHCENYRVDDETGKHLGVVERVIWSSEPFGEAEALVVRSPERQQPITIPLRQVNEIKPWSELIVVSAPVAPRHRRSRVAER
jgi:ribosomal 30S subunit maturation factor RimM